MPVVGPTQISLWNLPPPPLFATTPVCSRDVVVATADEGIFVFTLPSESVARITLAPSTLTLLFCAQSVSCNYYNNYYNNYYYNYDNSIDVNFVILNKSVT